MSRSSRVSENLVSDALYERLVALRRTFHRRPELAFEEKRTAGEVMVELDRLGVPHSYAGEGSAVLATLTVDADAPTIALRAEMDALPGDETTELPFASEVGGKMHACGHDAHMAMVLGAAHLLMQEPPTVNVMFVFQPAEERGGGARTVMASGELDGVDAIFGGHVTHHYKVGEIMVAEGVITAQSDRFVIDIHGRGGHGARPHEAIDAVVIMGLLITALQTLVSREINPVHPSVVTIGRAEAGSAANVIAEHAVLEGTIRTTDRAVRSHLHDGIQRMAQALGELHDARLDVEIEAGYPPVVNTATETEIAYAAARRIAGEHGMMQLDHPSLGSEDFSFYLEKIPGCYVRFGARPSGQPYVPLHSPAFDIDEAVLKIGAAYFDRVVREFAAAR